jgi:hypothetical protein
MLITDLPDNFRFIFDTNLNGAGYVFWLNPFSSKCYLADDLKELLLSDFDETLELLRFADLSKTPIREIQLPVLQRLKYVELKESARLKDLDKNDVWLTKLLGFN